MPRGFSLRTRRTPSDLHESLLAVAGTASPRPRLPPPELPAYVQAKASTCQAGRYMNQLDEQQAGRYQPDELAMAPPPSELQAGRYLELNELTMPPPSELCFDAEYDMPQYDSAEFASMPDEPRPSAPPPELPPPEFCCPITTELMRDPCIATDGHTYERQAIETWLLTNDTSPMTNMPLPDKWLLLPNNVMRSLIEEFRLRSGILTSDEERELPPPCQFVARRTYELSSPFFPAILARPPRAALNLSEQEGAHVRSFAERARRLASEAGVTE